MKERVIGGCPGSQNSCLCCVCFDFFTFCAVVIKFDEQKWTLVDNFAIPEFLQKNCGGVYFYVIHASGGGVE